MTTTSINEVRPFGTIFLHEKVSTIDECGAAKIHQKVLMFAIHFIAKPSVRPHLFVNRGAKRRELFSFLQDYMYH